MDNLIKLVVGDWYGDGHNFREYIDVRVNVQLYRLDTAYLLGTEIIGMNLEKEVEDYEVDSLSIAFVKACSDYLPIHKYVADLEENDFTIDVDDYAKLWLDIACLGNPSIQYEIIYTPVRVIGGYGLISI